MTEHANRKPRPGSLYDVLQVTPKAEPDVILASYRVLARLYHPDVNRDPESAMRMREINDAYDVLRDPNRRAQYDSERAWAAEARRTHRPSRTPINGSMAFGARAGSPRYAADVRVASTFRARMLLFIIAIFGVLAIFLWLLIDMMNESTIAFFAG